MNSLPEKGNVPFLAKLSTDFQGSGSRWRNRDDPQTGPPEHPSLNFFHKLGTIHNLRQLHIPRDLSAWRSSKLDDKNLVD